MTAPKRNRVINNIIDTSLFGGKLKPTQLSGINAILNEWINTRLKDDRWLAYIFATVYHETDKTMQPIEEYGKGRGKLYGSKAKYNKTMYELPDKLYYGRGFVQLTWYENYDKMGRILGLPLLEQPELLLQKEISAKVLIKGMVDGLFTGVSLKTYFNSTKDDPKNARKIINGLDKADLIAGYHNEFLNAIV